MQRLGWIVTVVGLVLTTLVLWLTPLPLGIPGEWTWPRIPADPQASTNLFLAGLAGGLYVGFIAYGTRRLRHPECSRLEEAVWVTMLGGASVFWIWNVQETAPPAGQLAKLPFVLYYPSSSGYFYKVRYESPQAGPLLSGYESLMAEGDHLHVGTHPPGLFLLFHGLRDFQQRFPGVTSWLYSWAPYSFRDAWEVVTENAARTEHSVIPADGVTLWLAGLLALLCAALTVWPLYVMLRWNASRETAWLAAALWPTLPAASIFIPKSDAAYPLIAALLVLATVGSWRRRSIGLAVLAGVILWLGLMASLAFLPVLLFCGVWILFDLVSRWRQQQAGRGRLLFTTIGWTSGFAVGFLLPIALLAWGCSINLFRVWAWNYRNHAGFYDDFTRTWWAWLLVNPVELAFAVGWPVFVLMLLASLRLLKAGNWNSAACRTLLAGGFVWGLLWLSGKNSGEAARLWLLFMPGNIWLVAQGFLPGPASSIDSELETPRSGGFLLMLALQLVACVLTVHRVGGFHLASP